MNENALIVGFVIFGILMFFICIKKAKQLIKEKEDEYDEQNI